MEEKGTERCADAPIGVLGEGTYHRRRAHRGGDGEQRRHDGGNLSEAPRRLMLNLRPEGVFPVWSRAWGRACILRDDMCNYRYNAPLTLAIFVSLRVPVKCSRNLGEGYTTFVLLLDFAS